MGAVHQNDTKQVVDPPRLPPVKNRL